MTAKKPTGSVLNDVLAKREKKVSPYQAKILRQLANEGHFDETNEVATERAAAIVYQIIPEKEPAKLVIPDYRQPTEEELAEQKQYSMRHNALSYAVQVYVGAVPLGEAGKRVGDVIVEAARVIEGYLSGNTD